MTLKEKLLGATRVAVEAYNTGMDPSSAVIKAAKEFGFNKDQSDRLTEMFNTALTLHEFEKHASDRTGEFPLADKAVVTSGLYTEPIKEKKASYDYSFYDSKARNFTKEAHVRPMEKAAEYIAPEELTPEFIAHQGMRYVTMAKQAAEEAKSVEDQIRAKMITDLYKLAESIKQGYDPENRYRKIKTAAKKYPKILENLERVLPERFTKLSASDEDDEDIVDFSDIEDEEELLKKLQGMMDNVNEFHMTSVSFSKKAEDMWNKVAGSFFSEEGLFDKIANRALEKKAAKDPSYTKALTNALIQWPSIEDIPNWQEEHDERVSDEAKEIERENDNLTRDEIISDLAMSDPIISEADPKDVVRAYSTLINIAPKVSLQKEIVRSILRQAVNSMAMSPYDAQSYVTLNNAMMGKRAPVNTGTVA